MAKRDYSHLFKHEDYWAVWLGMIVLLLALIFTFTYAPAASEKLPPIMLFWQRKLPKHHLKLLNGIKPMMPKPQLKDGFTDH